MSHFEISKPKKLKLHEKSGEVIWSGRKDELWGKVLHKNVATEMLRVVATNTEGLDFAISLEFRDDVIPELMERIVDVFLSQLESKVITEL